MLAAPKKQPKKTTICPATQPSSELGNKQAYNNHVWQSWIGACTLYMHSTHDCSHTGLMHYATMLMTCVPFILAFSLLLLLLLFVVPIPFAICHFNICKMHAMHDYFKWRVKTTLRLYIWLYFLFAPKKLCHWNSWSLCCVERLFIGCGLVFDAQKRIPIIKYQARRVSQFFLSFFSYLCVRLHFFWRKNHTHSVLIERSAKGFYRRGL